MAGLYKIATACFKPQQRYYHKILKTVPEQICPMENQKRWVESS